MEPKTHHLNGNLIQSILISGLIVGTLDIIAASIQTILNGREVLTMLKFIASGIFGKDALTGGLLYSFLGLFFHYCIATIWTTVFFLAYTRIAFFSKYVSVSGVLYGIFVWACMTQIILPLSNTPPLPFRLEGAIKSALIIIAAIGLPLAFLAKRYTSRGAIF